jgi:hypothetical protein
VALLFFLIALECAPFWKVRFFPSQDGPSHLYNATVLANYNKEAAYRDYYSVGLPLDGNVATQAIVVGLLKIGIAPRIAEKILLSIYALLLPLSLWYVLSAVTPQAKLFSLFAVLLIPNFFVHKGFWNFCFSIPLALFAFGYYIRRRESWRIRSIVIFAILGGILYLAHIAAWGVFAIGVGAYEVAARFSDLRPWAISSRQTIALCTLIPPGFLTLIYAFTTRVRSRAAITVFVPLTSRLRALCGLSFLHTLSPSDITAARAVAMLLALLFVSALIHRFRRERRFQTTDAFLLVGGVCALLAIFGPDAVGDGSYIHMRMSLFAGVFLVIWMAAQQWHTWTLRTLWIVLPVIAIVSLGARFPEYRRWDNVLREFTSIGPQIRSGATILGLRMDRDPDNIRPLLHAVDWLAPRPFIDLGNYEAGTDQFPLRFRRDHSPDGVLGKRAELEQAPPVFHIARYESQTFGCVDYILVYGMPDFAKRRQSAGADHQLRFPSYRLIYASEQPLEVRLYSRLRTCR